MTFSEISSILDSALQDLSVKKLGLDSATKAAIQAQQDYDNAMAKAQSLRQQLTSSLEEVMPPIQSNVRINRPSAA